MHKLVAEFSGQRTRGTGKIELYPKRIRTERSSSDHAYKPSIIELRVRLERRVLVAHTHRQVGVAIGRGSDFYGPPANSAALVIEHTTSQLRGMTFRIA
jgi:hypothetical protein